mgnify:CR=1 FL=1
MGTHIIESENSGDNTADEGKNIQKRPCSSVRPDIGCKCSIKQTIAISYVRFLCLYGDATVKASSLNVRSDAGTGYSAVARLAAGASVRITGEKTGTDGKTWYQIQYTGSSGQNRAQAMFLLPTYASRFRIPQMQIFEAYLTSQGFSGKL